MITYLKTVVVSEIVRNHTGSIFSQITNFGSGHARKLYKEHSREGRDISMCDCTCEKGFPLRIERAGIIACAIARAKKFAVSESREIARVVYLGQITNIESGRARKL